LITSCFDLVGFRQHGVAAKSKTTGWLTDCLLNFHGNELEFQLKSAMCI